LNIRAVDDVLVIDSQRIKPQGELVHLCGQAEIITEMWIYPSFCAWIREVLPSAQSPEDAYLELEARLEPVIVSRLRQAGSAFQDTDVADCRDEVFERMEEKLGKPMEFRVKLALRTRQETGRMLILAPGAEQASFFFEFEGSIAESGPFLARLVTGGKVVWENTCLAQRPKDGFARVVVPVPVSWLRHGQSYRLELEAPGSAVSMACQEFYPVQTTALHLLRADAFSIIGYHPDLEPRREYRADFRDMVDNTEVVLLMSVACSDDHRVPMKLAYDQLRHEHDTTLELSTGEPGPPPYFSCVRAVRHESLKSRMGFVTQVARNVAHEHSRSERSVQRLSLEDLPAERSPVRSDRAQSVAYLLAKSLIKRMPEWERGLLIEHQIQGRSWAEIASRRNVTEGKVKQDCSRALKKLARALLESDARASKGAGQRVVAWLKDMLEHVVTNEGRTHDA
jgi:hypothetical protein